MRILRSLLAVTALLYSGVAAAETLKDMISPVTHPVTFEDPRHSTELRPVFVYHEIGDDFVSEGGNAEVYALQARFKLTDDFSLIATKDGYVDLNPHRNVPKDTGFADIALGFKYSFYRADNAIFTGGLRYEIPVGNDDVFQGQGDGAFNPFVSYGVTCGDLNFMAGTGMRIAADDTDSSFWDTDLHVDYKIGNFYPLLEVNLVHVYQGGDRLGIADEGEDFFNFGAIDSAGKNILTMAAGARYRVTEDIDLGLAYQFPLDRTEGSNIIDWRITADAIFRFDI